MSQISNDSYNWVVHLSEEEKIAKNCSTNKFKQIYTFYDFLRLMRKRIVRVYYMNYSNNS